MLKLIWQLFQNKVINKIKLDIIIICKWNLVIKSHIRLCLERENDIDEWNNKIIGIVWQFWNLPLNKRNYI